MTLTQKMLIDYIGRHGPRLNYRGLAESLGCTHHRILNDLDALQTCGQLVWFKGYIALTSAGVATAHRLGTYYDHNGDPHLLEQVVEAVITR